MILLVVGDDLTQVMQVGHLHEGEWKQQMHREEE
jgi:hypothetical protein